MIKLSAAQATGGTLYGFGLTARNVELLKQGKPIHIFLAELAPNSKDAILIFFGENEEVLQKQIADAGFIGPNTIVK